MIKAEQVQRALFLSLSGISVSLINGGQQELAYLSMNSSPAQWHIEVKNKYKLLNMEIATWLEQHWKKNKTEVVLDDFLEVCGYFFIVGISYITIYVDE